MKSELRGNEINDALSGGGLVQNLGYTFEAGSIHGSSQSQLLEDDMLYQSISKDNNGTFDQEQFIESVKLEIINGPKEKVSHYESRDEITKKDNYPDRKNQQSR
jgi:hypothetical protein